MEPATASSSASNSPKKSPFPSSNGSVSPTKLPYPYSPRDTPMALLLQGANVMSSLSIDIGTTNTTIGDGTHPSDHPMKATLSLVHSACICRRALVVVDLSSECIFCRAFAVVLSPCTYCRSEHKMLCFYAFFDNSFDFYREESLGGLPVPAGHA
jgi:hypothetical protein